jgi:hypothetical protein
MDTSITTDVGAVANAVAGVADATKQVEANLAAQAGRMNTTAMQAAAAAQAASAQHQAFVETLAKAAGGDATAWAQVQQMLSSTAVLCLCLMFLVGCSGMTTATIVPQYGKTSTVASPSDDGVVPFDSGLYAHNKSGAVVTQGWVNNYARLLAKYKVNANSTFPTAGKAPNGCHLYQVGWDVLPEYDDLNRAEASGIPPPN